MLRQDGYFFLDHRDSPGFSEDEARMMGRPAGSVLFEADTLYCVHCASHVIKNPDRVRERASCRKCLRYICDGCEYEARQPGYVHAPFLKLVDDIRG